MKSEDKMKISLCMIVKNEADILKQSLLAVNHYIEDIVIVDTGSTDRTKEIAQDFTEKVYDFKWCDDFSAARNFSIEKASYDWVLVLDADEVVLDLKADSIKGQMMADASIVGRIKRVNLLADDMGEKRLNERISRFFNRTLFHYEGIIHEQIVRKDGMPYKTVPLDVTVEHTGYAKEVLQRTDKITRNITLLEQALNNNPQDVYLLYQLGKSYYLGKKFNEALKYFKQALSLSVNFNLEYIEDLVETFGYTLIHIGNYEEALLVKNYEKHYSNSPDFHFLLGYAYMNNGKFSQAIEQFTQCISNKEGKMEGINSYMPNYNIGVIYECLGYKNEAINYYCKCGDYPLAIKRLQEIGA
jgi:glycosyltransferase involved in cell wall biosynthesis